MSSKFTRTLHQIEATVLVANTVEESFDKVDVAIDDSGINWKGFKEGRISDEDVRFYIRRTLTRSDNTDFSETYVPVQVLKWQRIAGKYECTLDDFLKVAKKVD